MDGPQISIRSAGRDEGPDLTALALRAKSHWGYDERFLRSARNSLIIDAATISSAHIYVAEHDGVRIGFYGLTGEPPDGVLEWMFLETEVIGGGFGAQLWNDATSRARTLGYTELLIESDRYVAMGAVRVGSAPSPVDGADLPLLKIDLALLP